MDKRTLAAIVVGAVVAFAGSGWLAGRRIASPAEVAARTAPPVASPILVPVEDRLLSTDVVTRGTGRYGSPQKLTLATSTLKTSSGIVSEVAAPGTALREGDVALTASGRPLFVLVGARPVSRDLGPGMTGEDVRQLEASLTRLSLDAGPLDGVYDERTEAAVTALYTRAGFAAFTATSEQSAQVRAREGDLVTARAESLVAADALDIASAAVAAAHAALDDATHRAALAPGALDRARAQVVVNARAATADVAAARAALDAARADPVSSSAVLAAAERDVSVAVAAAETSALTGANDIAQAEAAVAFAEREVRTRIAMLTVAQNSRANAARVFEMRGRLTQLALEEADRVHRRAGVQVPADEVVFVATSPVRVSELLIGKGDPANGPTMIVTDSVVSVDAGLAVNDVALVKAGMTVKIEEPDLGISVAGVVKRIASTPGTDGVDGFHVYFETSVSAPPASLVGASVRLTIAVESSGGTVVAVPVSALTLAPDGTTRVQRQRNGVTEFVQAAPGLSADGYVAVIGDVRVGDLVVIGVEQKATPGG